ncbi:MAG: type IV toxin-antitoxin system AbiEi family antitoxin [Candidatus Delongbacteria bacterium]|jgi:predicted transcriptional regulator of viral defense system
MSTNEYIKELLSHEEYSFSFQELQDNVPKTEASLKSELARLVKKNEIVNLRRGFYLILPPRYSKSGFLPVQLYIDKLFGYLKRDYYLGFYSAAKFHGASHQQTQKDYIITQFPQILDIKKSKYDLLFYTISEWPANNIEIRKSDAGYFKISSPSLTAVDIIHYQKKIGGLNRILSVLEELTHEISYEDVEKLLKWYPNKSSLQRFGYFLEMFNADKKISDLVYENINSSKFYPVLLNSDTKQKAGTVSNRWKVDINIKLESDL